MNNQFFYPNFTPGVRIAAPAVRAIPGFLPSTTAAPSLGTGLSSLLGTRAPVALSATTTAAKGFTWSGLLNGASKTLGVINQAIPVVYQVKPIWNNAKTMFRVVKEINKSDNVSNNSNNNNSNSSTMNMNTNLNNRTTTSSNSVNSNSDDNMPTFFR